MDIELFFHIFDLAGTLVFALSGAIAAIRKRLDVYGITILAIVTALGGGMIRDVLLGRTPPAVFLDGSYLAISGLGALRAIAGYRAIDRFHHPLRIMDAIGLGIFTVIGVKVSLASGGSWYAAVMLGVMTGTGGGMLRDLLNREVPMVLQREVYAVASLAGAAAYIGWLQLPLVFGSPLPAGLGAVLAAALTAALRIVAVYQNWHLPKPASRIPPA
jgi:uncharacterized membrane protein YeiH